MFCRKIAIETRIKEDDAWMVKSGLRVNVKMYRNNLMFVIYEGKPVFLMDCKISAEQSANIPV